MQKITVNIVGCGKLGKTIGYLLARNPDCEIKWVLNRTHSSAQKAVDFIGYGRACRGYNELEKADLWLISSVDGSILDICSELAVYEKFSKETIVLHFSGTFSSKLLYSASKQGCLVGSLHPLRSFADPKISVKDFNKTYCSYEGDNEAFSVVKTLFEKIGAVVFRVNQEEKAIYHAASVFASNYILALLKLSYDCFCKSGVNRDVIFELIKHLALSTINNIHYSKSFEKSLTGPISRGELEIIKKHLDVLGSQTVLENIYKNLGKVILDIMHHNGLKNDEINNLFL